MRNEGTVRYGRRYFCAKTATGEIYVMANRAEITAHGDLLFWGTFQADYDKPDDGQEILNLALSAGQWSSMYAASLMNGDAIAVEHWVTKKQKSGETREKQS